MMKAPRHPKKESTATTIRILRHQLATAQHTVRALQMDRADKEKVIAGYDVQLSEADDEVARLRRMTVDQAVAVGEANDKMNQWATRLSFLEGYHARSQEILPHDPAKTHRGPGQGDPKNLQDGAQNCEATRQENRAGWSSAGIGGALRSLKANYPACQDRGPVESSSLEEIYNAIDTQLDRNSR